MENKLGGKIMKGFVTLITKIYIYLEDKKDENKKNRRHKKCLIKRKLRFEKYKHCLEATQDENKINQPEIYYKLEVYFDTIRKNHKEFIKKQNINSKFTSKIWKREK